MDETKSKLEQYVRQFLYEFKALVLEKGLFVTERVKNKESLIELGLTAKQREEIILALSTIDYNAGPIKDEYKTGQYWVFGKHVEGVEIYIKLKIAEQDGDEHAICFSFHKSEQPLSYPFKQ
jgi:hypothetical protein